VNYLSAFHQRDVCLLLFICSMCRRFSVGCSWGGNRVRAVACGGGVSPVGDFLISGHAASLTDKTEVVKEPAFGFNAPVRNSSAPPNQFLLFSAYGLFAEKATYL